MKWCLLALAFLVGCGGSGGGTTVPNIPFVPPTLDNGSYTGLTNITTSNPNQLGVTVVIDNSGIQYTVEGYAPVNCPRDWSCTADFNGEPATMTLEKRDNGYRGTIYRDGLGWSTRTQTLWRSFLVE